MWQTDTLTDQGMLGIELFSQLKSREEKFPGGENALKWNKKLPLKLLILIKTYFYVDKLLINKVYLALNRLDWFNYLKPVRREKNSNQQFIFLLVNVRKSL